MNLRRLNAQKPKFDELNEMIQAMENLLEGKDTDLTLEELCFFQGKDGSFSLFDSNNIPNEAIIDYINMPTYIATSIFMKAYLKGNRKVKNNLITGLNFACKTGFRGHGYDAEKARIKSLRIFIEGGLAIFLEREEGISPRFHNMIKNILHDYNFKLINGKTIGPWGEDYREDWEDIVRKLKIKRRLYIAYGSNMNKEQMYKRCPDTKVVGKTYLKKWELTIPFYANIEPNKEKNTPVLIWGISNRDEIELDKYEGYPKLYNKRDLIININNRETTAMVYIMTDKYKNVKMTPREGYVESIIKGYEDAGFEKNEFESRKYKV